VQLCLVSTCLKVQVVRAQIRGCGAPAGSNRFIHMDLFLHRGLSADSASLEPCAKASSGCKACANSAGQSLRLADLRRPLPNIRR
jgi:hypothetical protein